MKKILSSLTAFALMFSGLSLTGCSSVKNGDTSANAIDNKSDSLSVVCTIFPEYDWVKQIVGENNQNIKITYLLDNGVDLHSYQPTAQDMIKISECDLFIYAGGESDKWVEDALEDTKNSSMQVISLLDTMGSSAKEEELKEGMECEEENEDDEEETEYDEHVWLSLKNAKFLCGEIESKLELIDPENADSYRANLESYTEKLDSLDLEFEQTLKNADTKTLLFGDRFPFRYFTDDYGLDYYAAFAGCSAETEASFDTIAFLAEKVDELSLENIFIVENSDGKIAKTIIQNTKNKNAQILTLNSLQSVSSKDNKTYLSVMTENLETIKKAL